MAKNSEESTVDSRTARRTFLKSVGAASAVGLAGCLGGDGGDEDVITLGGSMSLSGDNADLGQLYEDAYELTIDRINENGGVEAGDGNTYELEMVLRDDETDASKSQSIYQELIDQEGIDYLLGPYASSVTLPASQVAADNEKPMVEGGGASPEIFAQGNDWIFGLLPTADKYGLSYVDMVREQDPTPESIALLAEDDTFSQSTADGAREYVTNETDLDLVVDQTFPSDTSDLSTNLGQVRDQGADVLLLCAHQKHNIVLANQMETQNVNLDAAMGTVGTLNESFKNEVGANGDYIYGPSSWAVNANFDDPVYGGTQDFVSGIEEDYGYTPDYHSAAGEAVIMTFKNAFETVDELTPANVRDRIDGAEPFSTVYGSITFDDRGVIDKNMLVYQWQPDPGLQIVYPTDVQQSEPIYPTPGWDER